MIKKNSILPLTPVISRDVIRGEPSRSSNKRVKVRFFLNESSHSFMLNESNFLIGLDSVIERVKYTRELHEPGLVPDYITTGPV